MIFDVVEFSEIWVVTNSDYGRGFRYEELKEKLGGVHRRWGVYMILL